MGNRSVKVTFPELAKKSRFAAVTESLQFETRLNARPCTPIAPPDFVNGVANSLTASKRPPMT